MKSPRAKNKNRRYRANPLVEEMRARIGEVKRDPKTGEPVPSEPVEYQSLFDYVQRVHGGVSQLAKALGVSVSIISMYATGTRRVPVERCFEIERATEGKVTVEMLRPDMNWTRYRKPRKKNVS